MKHFKLLLIPTIASACLMPIVSCSNGNNDKVKSLDVSITKTYKLGDQLKKEDISVKAIYSDSKQETVTDFTTDVTLPYTFVDYSEHEITVTYKEVSAKVKVQAYAPTDRIFIYFSTDGHGLVQSSAAALVEKGTTWGDLPRPVVQPDTNYILDKWVDSDGKTIDNSYTFTQHCTIKAIFKQVTTTETGFKFLPVVKLPGSVKIGYAISWDGETELPEDLVLPISYQGPTDPDPLPILEISGHTQTTLGFADATYVKSVTIPESVTKIGENAFSSTNAKRRNQLKQVVFTGDSQLEEIEANAFQNCQQIESISIPKNTVKIDSNAFSMVDVDSKLSNVYIPSDGQLTTIGESAFSHCKKLTSITIPSKLKTLNGLDFTGIESIIIPDNVTTIDKNCFGDSNDTVTTQSLKSITFGVNSQLQNIGEKAFRGCQLSSISIPDSVTTIGNRAFEHCTNLSTVSFGNNSKCSAIGTTGAGYVFNDTNITSFVVPKYVNYLASSQFGLEADAKITSLEFKDTTSVWEYGGGLEKSEFVPSATDFAKNASHFKKYNSEMYWQKHRPSLTFTCDPSKGEITGSSDPYVNKGTLWKDVKKPQCIGMRGYKFNRWLFNNQPIDDNYEITDDMTLVAEFI